MLGHMDSVAETLTAITALIELPQQTRCSLIQAFQVLNKINETGKEGFCICSKMFGCLLLFFLGGGGWRRGTAFGNFNSTKYARRSTIAKLLSKILS